MYNNLKREIEKDFDKKKNYNSIISKSKGVSNMKKIKIRYVLATSCVIIITVIGIVKSNLLHPKNIESVNNCTESSENPKWKVKKVYKEDNFENADITTNEWNEMEITEQYCAVNYNNIEYQSTFNKNKAVISKEFVEEELGTSIAEGFDENENKKHKINVKVFKIKSISSNCIIALQFKGDANYYAYVNTNYKPATLEDFINDLNLKDIVSFEKIDYRYFDTNSKGQEQYEKVEFYNVNKESIWQMLFNDSFSKNIYCNENTFSIDNDIVIHIKSSILGEKYYGIVLSNNGYMMINILKSSTIFYLGESRVKEFINYIINNYDGYKIEYVDEITDDDETDTKAPEIMVEENNMVNTSENEFVVEENKVK